MRSHTKKRMPSHRPQSSRLQLERLETRETPAMIGSLDLSFGNGGGRLVPFDLGGGNNDQIAAVAVQPDGKIVAVGQVQMGTNDYDFGIIRLNPDGSLDHTFNGTGMKTVAFNLGGQNVDGATCVAIQADGKIVVAGGAQRSATDVDFAVIRLNPDGSMDKSFNGDGERVFGFDIGGGWQDMATGVAIQADGKIVVAGVAQVGANDTDFAVARLNPNGTLDNTFDGDGKQTIAFNIGGGKQDMAYSVAIQADGKIVLAGIALVSAIDADMAVARLNPNGSLDSNFNGSGKKTIAFDLGGGNQDSARGVAIQADGKIVVAGVAQAGATDTDTAVARLNPNGTLDNTFDGDGKRTIPLDRGGQNQDVAYKVAIQADGKIVLAGAAQTGATGFDMAVVRLTTNGALDNNFNDDGINVIGYDAGGGNEDRALGLALQPDGKIVLAGFVQKSTTNYDFAVVRVTGALGHPNPLSVGGNPSGAVPVYRADNLASYNTTPVATSTPIPGTAVNTALADVNGDGVVDLIAGAAEGSDRVVVLDGRDGKTPLASFNAFGGYGGGVFVAAGDMNRDGRAEVVVSPASGGLGPRVVVFDGASMTNGTNNPTKLADFNGIADAITGEADNTPGTLQLVGGRVAVGDVNGDGIMDLAVAAGNGGGPRVTIWDGANVAAANGKTPAAPPLANAFVFEDSQRDGAFITLGDVTGDGKADLIAGGGPNGGPRIRIGDMGAILTAKNFGAFDTQLGVVKSNFFAGDPNSRGGIRVTARDIDGDNIADLVVGSGTGQPSRTQVFLGKQLVTFTGGVQKGDQDFDPFGATLPGGVYVG